MFYTSYGRPSLPLAVQNFERGDFLDFYASMADLHCLSRFEILKIEGLGFFKPLWRSVVASGGATSSQKEGLRFVEPLWPTVVASSGSKSSRIQGLCVLKPLWWTVVASGGSKSSTSMCFF